MNGTGLQGKHRIRTLNLVHTISMLRQLVYKDSVKLSEEDDDDEDTDMATKYVFMTTFNQDRKG